MVVLTVNMKKMVGLCNKFLILCTGSIFRQNTVYWDCRMSKDNAQTPYKLSQKKSVSLPMDNDTDFLLSLNEPSKMPEYFLVRNRNRSKNKRYGLSERSAAVRKDATYFYAVLA